MEAAASERSLEEECEEALQPVQRLAASPAQEANQLSLLRHLLAVERQRNQQRRDNNQQLKKCVSQLQVEYLRSQREVVEALETAHKVKALKEAQLATLEATLAEKERLIGQLKDSSDESRLRQEFEELTRKQETLAQLEREQLKAQIESLERQLVSERVANSETLQKFELKLDRKSDEQESECARLREQLAKSEAQVEGLLERPENQLIKTLREENRELAGQAEELKRLLSDSESKYERLEKSLEELLAEQEQLEGKNLEAIVKLQEQESEQRVCLSELKMALEDREEVVQILQFNLQRSEKRVKNLLGALKGKEATYKEMLDELQSQHADQMNQKACQMRLLERRLLEAEVETDKRQNEIVRLQLEHGNQIDSIRTDRDERLSRLEEERDKFERALRAAELRLAKENRSALLEGGQVERSQTEALGLREENQRLSVQLVEWRSKVAKKQAEADGLRGRLEKHCQEFDCQRLKMELEEARRRASRGDEMMGQLQKDNNKLQIKLKLHEANMGSLSETIKKEHAKMVRDYERRLEQIRSEQDACDQSRIRYRRHANRLKKYCEHLRKAHSHICNPTVCGPPDQQTVKTLEDSSSEASKGDRRSS